MTELDDDVDRRLARLAAATDRITARPGFEERVLAAIAVEGVHAAPSSRVGDWLSGVAQLGRVALGASLLLAGVATIGAVMSARQVETEAALAYGTVELEAW